MAIERIEEYRQQNGVDILKVYTKPTKAFPSGGYFYAPAEVFDLVKERGWFLNKIGNGIMITARNWGTCTSFHQELCKFYHGVYVDCIDHINIVDIDNTDGNLNIVTNQQNNLNKFTRGYMFGVGKNYKIAFRPQIMFNGQIYCPFSQVHKEDEACILQYKAETEILKEMMGDDYYQFDFKKYRRGSEDILDLERTGVISEEEAIYRHVLKYSDNAWYMLRYGLEDYYRQYNIPIPQYSLDSDGFMVHPITGQKLCPFIK